MKSKLYRLIMSFFSKVFEGFSRGIGSSLSAKIFEFSSLILFQNKKKKQMHTSTPKIIVEISDNIISINNPIHISIDINYPN